MDWWPLLWSIIKALLIVVFVLANAFLIWVERKIAGRFQRRLGPMRVGRPHGWAQTFADLIKLLSKEDVVPGTAEKWLFLLAPIVAFLPALLVYMVIPFGPTWVVNDLNIGVIFISAVTSFSVLSFFMSGWGSNNKYSVMGAFRAAAQLMSYEVPLVLSMIAVVMLAGSLSLNDIVKAQNIPFVVLQPLGFLTFFIAAVAELNRTPFDLAEAESELVAGYNTEYSGMRWAFFFLSEYANTVSASAIMATLFFGGWRGFLLPLPPVVWFLIKTYIFVFIIMWVRWTLPRVRIDQLLNLGWKLLLPVALLNIAWTGLLGLVFKI